MLAVAMIEVLITWLIVGAAMVGIGLLWRGVFGLDLRDRGGPHPGPPPAYRGRELARISGSDIFLSFWCGFALVLMFLQFWNLASRINGIAFLIVLVVGLIGLIIRARSWRAWIARILTTRGGTLILILLATIWVSNRAIGPGNAEDSGLYHYRAVRWAAAYPIVPGIGNLSSALALNNISFLYDAMLESGPWHRRSEHVANGLLLAMMLAGIIASAARIWRNRDSRSAGDFYLLTLLPVVIYLMLGKDVSNPKTDLPVGFMTFIVGYLGLRLLSEPLDSNERRFGIVTLALLAAAAICLKFSSVVVVTLIGLIVLIAWLKRDRPGARAAGATIAGVFITAILLIGPWVARNIIMSGYPLFPAKVAPVDVQWKVPEPAVDYLIGSIRNQAKAGLIIWAYDSLNATGKRPLVIYARLMKPPFTSRDEVHGLEWVRPWFFSLPVTSPIEVVLPFCMAIVAGWVLLRRGIGRFGAGGWLLIPMLAGVAFWLWAGPEPRYGWQTMWALAAMVVALAFASTGPRWTAKGALPSPAPGSQWRGYPRILVVLAILLALPGITYRAGVAALLRHGNPIAEVPFLGPGVDHGFHPHPVQTFKTVQTHWGVDVYVPDRPDQPLSWDGPIPCTAWPPLDMDLRLRDDRDLSHGFFISRPAPMIPGDARAD
jgi:hypothetical protein